MCSKNFIKRIVPFFLTFAVGLFIASFFITLSAPTFRFPFRGGERFRRHQQNDRMMELENQRLREENERLKADSEAKVKIFSGTFEMDKDGRVKRIEKMEYTFDTDSSDELVPPPASMQSIRK